MIEKIIAYYCAPALVGIKPANIVSCRKDKISKLHMEIERLNNELNCRDIYFEVLCECENRVLLMVYRSKILTQYLQREDIRGFLKTLGYNEKTCLIEDIQRLKSRIKENDFPHEIGAFLGYPIHDIYGFIYHRNEGCILTGEWKVYKDADKAAKLFARYTSCRRALSGRIQQGKTLAEVFPKRDMSYMV